MLSPEITAHLKDAFSGMEAIGYTPELPPGVSPALLADLVAAGYTPPAPEAPECTPEEAPETTPDYSVKSNKCTAVKPNGQPCRAYALTSSTFCIYHDPVYAPRLREAAARGGAAERTLIFSPEALPIDFNNRVDIAIALEAIVRLQFSGAIPHKRCAQILRTLSIAERNLSGMQRDGLQTTGHAEDYAEKAAATFEALPIVAAILDNEELDRRCREIADAGAKREEVLKANQRWRPHPEPEDEDPYEVAPRPPAPGTDSPPPQIDNRQSTIPPGAVARAPAERRRPPDRPSQKGHGP